MLKSKLSYSKSIHSLFIFFLLFIISSQVFAGAGSQRFNAFRKSIKSLKANFSQKVVDRNEKAVEEESTGKVYLSRPGMFRFDYIKPSAMNIVSNGKKVWMYEHDLETLKVSKVGEKTDNAMAKIFSESRPIENEFKLVEKGRQGKILWIELVPKNKDASLQFVRLGFTDTLSTMEYQDNLGYKTTIRFTQLVRNPKLDKQLFEFKKPGGKN